MQPCCLLSNGQHIELGLFLAGQPRPEDKTAHGIRLINERALAANYARLGRRDYCDRMIQIQHSHF
jgi:hypothetical protein